MPKDELIKAVKLLNEYYKENRFRVKISIEV